jgi:hypothetical protein
LLNKTRKRRKKLKMTTNCEFCGNKLNEEHACETCNCRLEERMNFSGYHFDFVEKVIRRRRFKTLPFPTREKRCENCTFNLKIVKKYVNRKTGNPCNNLPGFEYQSCRLAPLGYDYDTRSVFYLPVKNTSQCKRFKKRRKEKCNTEERVIVL